MPVSVGCFGFFSRRHVEREESFPAPNDEEVLLPRTCYFNNGTTKVDYVIVYPKISPNIRDIEPVIGDFVKHMQDKGLLVESEPGQFYKTLVFLKIHGPSTVLLRYASIYNIELACRNPYYMFRERILCKTLTTELTNPNPKSKIYYRARKTLSGQKPTELTTVERSLIVHRIVNQISFLRGLTEVTLKKLLRDEVFLQAYPIHDGPYEWTPEGPLTDRQLLYKFWANIKYLFIEQPIHLIEKYYGPKVAFYFALQNFYTKMLVMPTVLGIVTVIAGSILLSSEGSYIDDEVCSSNLVICSDQRLKTACTLTKISYIIDNPVTVVYVILNSFWGAIFWTIWQRRQAMLRLRWNLSGAKADRTMRPEFKEGASTRRSSITGEIEYYVHPYRKILVSVVSYSVMLLLVLLLLCTFLVAIFLIIQYRFLLQKNLNYDAMRYANELELLSSAVITTIIIMLLNSLAPTMLRFYAAILGTLTELSLPRTELQYNRMYMHKMFTLNFANHCFPLFYLAFFKGFFHTYPTDRSKYYIISRLQSDLCKPSGCLVDLGMQLVTIMVLKAFAKFTFFSFNSYMRSVWYNKWAPPKKGEYGQWERDYLLQDVNQSTIDELYAELALQYSLLTFFNASLPLIGLIALLHNVFKIQHEAYKFVKLRKRPIFEKVADIEGWNQIFKVLTVLGTVSNAFVVAFRTDFVLRKLYRMKHDNSLKGYVNSTLSKFAIADFDEKQMLDHGNATFCYYRGSRYPPEYDNKYQPTVDYWRNLAVRSVYFVVLENFTLILSLCLSYIIPEVPRKVKVKLEYDERILRAARETQLENETQR